MLVGATWPWLAFGLGGMLGGVVGSFIGCMVARLPEGTSLWGPSRCDGCGRRLTLVDLLPVLSWLALRGRCRTCGSKVGVQTLLLEILSTIVGALVGGWIGLSLWFFPLMLVLLLGYALVVIGLLVPADA